MDDSDVWVGSWYICMCANQREHNVVLTAGHPWRQWRVLEMMSYPLMDLLDRERTFIRWSRWRDGISVDLRGDKRARRREQKCKCQDYVSFRSCFQLST